MIDCILKFASEAAAKTALDKHVSTEAGAAWSADHIIPDVKVWRKSQDVITMVDGQPVVTHTYLPGYFVLVSMDDLPPGIRNAAAVQVVFDRDKMVRRERGAILRSTVTRAVLRDLAWEPVFAGTDVPSGEDLAVMADPV